MKYIAIGIALALGLAGAPTPARAQSPSVNQESAPDVGLSLEEAVERATGQSEEVRLARSQIDLADAQVGAARALALPQINGTFGYNRTFESSFGTGSISQAPDSLGFDPDPSLPLEERVRYLEERVPTAAMAGLGQSFGSLPFGQERTMTAQVSGSQLLYAGGSVRAALDIARSYRTAAELSLAEEVAEIELQVGSAYYQALLAQELEEIAVVGLEQAEDFLQQAQLRLDAEQASELEVLRAEVSRDNLRPQLVEARNAAELAMLNLKRLVDLPLDARVDLTTPLQAPDVTEATVRLESEVLIAQRAAVRAAEEQVEIGREQVGIARSAFLPRVSVSMTYGKQAFPNDPFDFGTDWRTDWSAGLQVQVPLFNGGARFAELERTQVELDQKRLQLSQLRESVQVQYQQALGEKERALEAIAARETTVTQAQRVYDLTVLQYDEGLATQLEVSQSRLELLQARTNLAQAITDYYVADAGLTRSTVDADAAALPSSASNPGAGATPPDADPPVRPDKGRR